VIPIIGQFFPKFELADVEAGHWVISENPEGFRDGEYLPVVFGSTDIYARYDMITNSSSCDSGAPILTARRELKGQ
jgi:hypothetical protein